MTSKSRQIQELLSVLAQAIDISPHSLSAQAVGNALYGLQGMSSEVPSVRMLLRVLAKKINAMPSPKPSASNKPSTTTTPTPTNNNHNKNTTNNNHNNHTDNNNVPSTSPSASPSPSLEGVSEGEYMLTGQHIGNALWGLRNCTSDHPEVGNR